MHALATSTAPSKHTVPATVAAKAASGASSCARAASHAAAVTASEVSSISAHRCLIAWKAPIFLPNCSRTPAYSTAVSRHHLATPEASAAASVTTSARSRSRSRPGTTVPSTRRQVGARRTPREVRRDAPRPGRHRRGAPAPRRRPEDQGVRGSGPVVDHPVGAERERDPLLPRATGPRGRPAPRRRGGAEQRPGDECRGTRLDGDGEVEQRAAVADDREGIPASPISATAALCSANSARRVVLGSRGPPRCRRARRPTSRTPPPARGGRR